MLARFSEMMSFALVCNKYLNCISDFLMCQTPQVHSTTWHFNSFSSAEQVPIAFLTIFMDAQPQENHQTNEV